MSRKFVKIIIFFGENILVLKARITVTIITDVTIIIMIIEQFFSRHFYDIN